MPKYTRQELEQLLHDHYYGKFCHLALPLQQEVYGICDGIAVDHNGIIIINMKDRRYECSLECLKDYFKVLSNPKEKLKQ